MITLQNISKKFKEVELFENLNVELPPNQKILIKGINGSGKSVLLKMIVGYSSPDSGKIIIDHFELGKDGDFIPDAGVSINAPEFLKNWTGMENLIYLAKIRKKASQEDILQLADQLAMTKSLHKKYKTYSLGMKQKLRLIQALMEHPKYLILDEPFDALDKTSKTVVMQLLENYLLEDAARSFLFTSHNDLDESFANKVYEINHGDLQLQTISG